jgi:hypothetical protein
VFVLLLAAIIPQPWNATIGHGFAPLLIALCSNLGGSAMQSSRLIQSAFRQGWGLSHPVRDCHPIGSCGDYAP